MAASSGNCGATNALTLASFGGAPVGATYADGQHWDVRTYPVPAGAARATVRLLYQTTTKEHVEFLRAENHTDARGDRLHELWSRFGKGRPEVMNTVTVFLGAGATAPARVR